MQRRFFIEPGFSGELVTIDGPDAHHILHVNRMKVGESICLFDGSGHEYLVEIVSAAKKSLTARIVQTEFVSREWPFQLTLAVALPKGDRQKVLIEKLVELGVTSLIPINTSRSVATAHDKSLPRLRRTVIEASKQCGRNQLMEIEPAISFEDLVEKTFEPSPGIQSPVSRWICHPYFVAGSSDRRDADQRNASPGSKRQGELSDQIIAIGPEGGFTDDEIALASGANWQSLSLGPAVLRIETAAAAAATLFGIGQSF